MAKSTTMLGLTDIVERERDRLEDLAKNGRPPVYASWDEWLTDWTMDFSWNRIAITEMTAVATDPECVRLCELVKRTLKYDLHAEIVDTIRELVEDEE